jgi:hypothetical protein
MSTEPKSNTNRPTHAIYQVIGDDDKARWNRVGSAWLHKDTQGANLKFDSMPMHGRIVVRAIKDIENGAEAQGGA